LAIDIWSSVMDQPSVHDNRQLNRFELPQDGQVVFADYHRQPGRLVITYVEAPPALRGSGAAGKLMQGMLEQARAEGVKVLPLCGYARAWIQRHPEFRDLAV
jgi:predicted GNAT family acetyltransferase